MRTKQIIPGLSNTHKFRAIVNGVGFYTTPKQMVDMPFMAQRVAVWTALESCVTQKITGVVKTVKSYDYNMNPVEVTVQITL
jgi:hypothetical protein